MTDIFSNNKVLWSTLAGIILIACIWWWLSPYPITNYPSSNTGIIAFGDSLVYGTGSTRGNDFVSLLSHKLGVEIKNHGVPGDTTQDGVSRVSDIAKTKPKVAIVLLGGNDALRRISRETTFANLETIITTFQRQGSIVLLLGVRGGLLGDSYADSFQDLAEKTGSAYVENVLDGLFGNREYMSDTIHPNDKGYARIAERIVPVLRDLLK